MTEKRFTIQSDSYAEEIKLLIDKEQMVMWSFLHHDEAVNSICDLLNELHETLQSKNEIIKGQELEIVRLHGLADAMSGILRELGIHDVYNQEQIMKIKEKLR